MQLQCICVVFWVCGVMVGVFCGVVLVVCCGAFWGASGGSWGFSDWVSTPFKVQAFLAGHPGFSFFSGFWGFPKRDLDFGEHFEVESDT